MLVGHRTFEPVYARVPLSCVPPINDVNGRQGLTDKLWNCSVDRPAFMLISLRGTLDRRRVQAR
jgi:hypothetical protein